MTQNRSDKVSPVIEKQKVKTPNDETHDVEKRVFHSPKQVAYQAFEFVLPVKITGVVFWGLVLVGLIIAVFLLQG